MEHKTIMVDYNTHKRLLQLKIDIGHKTLNDVIKGLLDNVL